MQMTFFHYGTLLIYITDFSMQISISVCSSTYRRKKLRQHFVENILLIPDFKTTSSPQKDKLLHTVDLQ
jgi:hypothetical protein